MITPVLRAGECRIWWANPQHRAAESMAEVLSEAELERAARFRRDPDRRRFLTGSWLLRVVTAAQLGIRPEDVDVERKCSDCTRHHGKPHIRTQGPPLHVSVSHSGNRVAVALTAEGPLGVDVEAVPSTPVDDLVRCALSEDERRALEVLPESERYEAFARVWVRKEAALKATGHGLRISPDKVRVSGPEESPELLHWPLAIPPAAVQYHALDPGDGYVGVVALLSEGRRARVIESHVTDLQPVGAAPLLVAA
ncbi:4'-phosphopantetheinyl transferase superfamily protein [Planomonospora sp. ID67723]|uniref:4'-phosphopantetheinyl transferase family protein n=1 Tax=Planomonospora sp. ID67723 TaxID=2738134 RepID=UPI0018C363ED|nr:4'-phosphopantetheinyl transferase superfamily protein [Planomonospora sp. ID67723]MBG0829077.1 4'-phosphopantetheinyl transferase superfamily protein [Planomonospora sp. ID67723]